MGEGRKWDKGKDRFDLIPPKSMQLLAKVLTLGANKYGANNWQNVEAYRYVGALGRHLNAHRQGETIDPESGLPHLAHCLTNVVFLLEKYLEDVDE